MAAVLNGHLNGVQAGEFEFVLPNNKMTDQEQVEMEQVPLKSDTDKPAVGDADQPAAEEAAEETKADEKGKSPSRFRQWFTRAEKKPAEATDAEAPPTDATETAASEPPVKKFKAPKWLQRKPKDATNGAAVDADQMTIGLNMLDRDEKNINEHVKLSFEDVFAEPDGYHSWDCAWRLTYRVFTGTRTFFYRLLALLCALPCAIVWGLVFAILTVANVFACVPLARACAIPGTWIAKLWNFVVRSLFDPCFRSCGLCLGSISVRRYGLSVDPTADMA